MGINRRLGLLSTREKEFLGYIKEGLSVKSISHQLNISPKTGHAHRRSIHQKMGVDSDAFLVKMLQSLEPAFDSSILGDKERIKAGFRPRARRSKGDVQQMRFPWASFPRLRNSKVWPRPSVVGSSCSPNWPARHGLALDFLSSFRD